MVCAGSRTTVLEGSKESRVQFSLHLPRFDIFPPFSCHTISIVNFGTGNINMPVSQENFNKLGRYLENGHQLVRGIKAIAEE